MRKEVENISDSIEQEDFITHGAVHNRDGTVTVTGCVYSEIQVGDKTYRGEREIKIRCRVRGSK